MVDSTPKPFFLHAFPCNKAEPPTHQMVTNAGCRKAFTITASAVVRRPPRACGREAAATASSCARRALTSHLHTTACPAKIISCDASRYTYYIPSRLLHPPALEQTRQCESVVGKPRDSVSSTEVPAHPTLDPPYHFSRPQLRIVHRASIFTRPLTVTSPPFKLQSRTLTMSSTDPTSSSAKEALNHEIEENLKANTSAAAPADDSQPKPKPKKEKQPKQPKNAPSTAPLTPALIDLRVGHILRAIAHPNADSLYVSTIAMGDPEGTEHTQVDEETGKVVRTVCSGLNGLVPLEEMQNRKVVVVANLKPVNMRSIKSAAMVLAASPPAEEGADPHAADRVVELVSPPEGAEAGDLCYFEGWPYGDGRGPEKVLNPKKKQWEAIQPGFYTSDDLVVGFDAQKSEVGGIEKGDLIVDGKGKCTVKSLKGAVVR